MNTIRMTGIITIMILSVSLLLSGCGSKSPTSSSGGGTPTILMGGSIQGIALNLASRASMADLPATGLPGGTGWGGMTTDGANIYVTHYSPNSIFKINIATGSTSQIVPTIGIAGGATTGVTTDGTNLYIVDNLANVYKTNIVTGSTSVLTAALTGTLGITTDGTNLYVGCFDNTIQKVNIATGVTTLLAGSAGVAGSADGIGSAALFSVAATGNPTLGVTTDGTNVYVADSGNNTIRKIVIATGQVSTLAGTAGVAGNVDGTGTAASFSNPTTITTDGTDLYIIDVNTNLLRKINKTSGQVITITNSTINPGYQGLYGITTDGNKLFVINPNSGAIQAF